MELGRQFLYSEYWLAVTFCPREGCVFFGGGRGYACGGRMDGQIQLLVAYVPTYQVRYDARPG